MKRIILLTILLAALFHCQVFAQEAKPAGPLSVAVLNFEDKGDEVEGTGEKVGVLLTAYMSANEKLMTVERADLQKSLDEFEMSLSGVVSADSAAKIGQISGADVLVTGRIFPVGKQKYIVAKVIGVETSRVFGETEKYTDEEGLDVAVANLNDKIGRILAKNRSVLVTGVESEEERIARLREIIGKKGKGKGKKIYISIPEHHMSQAIPDPAAQTEMLLLFQKLGFDITDKKESADIRIIGEAFSERATQRGQLISCRARAEIKRLDKKGKLISVDRQTEVAVDLAENVAAKLALQKAGLVLAERLIKEL